MDFQPESVTTYKTIIFLKRYELNAGDKLTDQADLVEIAQKTVPTGKKANVSVTIEVQLEDV